MLLNKTDIWSLCSGPCSHVWRTGMHKSIGVDKSLWWWKVYLMPTVCSVKPSLEYDSIFFSQESWRVRLPFPAGSVRRLLMSSLPSLSSRSRSLWQPLPRLWRKMSGWPQARQPWKPCISYRWELGLWPMPFFFSTTSVLSCLDTRRDPQTRFSPHSCGQPLVLLSLGSPTMAAFISRKPPSPLGCKFCVLFTERAAAPPVLHLRPEHLSALHAQPSGEKEVMAQGRSPQDHSFFLLHLLAVQCFRYIYVPVKITASPNRRNYSHAQSDWFCSQVPAQGLSSCGPPRTPCLLASWSVQRLLGASPAKTPPEGAVYPHPPLGTAVTSPGDHSRPHHPDAGGHLRHLLRGDFCSCFLYHCLFWFSTMVDTDLWYLCFLFSHHSPFLLLLRDPRTARICSWIVSRYG